jgi:hypothetical protein
MEKQQSYDSSMNFHKFYGKLLISFVKGLQMLERWRLPLRHLE